MEKINPDGKQPDQSKLIVNRRNWKKPVLIELDVKQTLNIDCGSGIDPIIGDDGMPTCPG